jgi:ABC-type transport system substrate-binding protein
MLAESETWLNTTALSVTLREGVRFHDGTPFNSEAVKWNINRLLYLNNHTGQLTSEERKGSPASLYEDPTGEPLLAGWRVTGTLTGVLLLAQPYSPVMDLMCYTAGVMLSPTAHTADEHTFIDLTTGDLVGTGPYKYDEYIAEQEVRFTRWDSYWGGPMPHEGLIAHFEKMVYVVIDDPSTRNYAILAHDVDWLAGAITDLFDTFREEPTITFTELDNAGIGISYLGFNNRQINVTWRKAMNYAFNYSYMIDDYWQGRVFRSYGWVSPGYGAWYTDEVEEVGPYYNLTIARSIISPDVADPTLVPVEGVEAAAGLPIDEDISETSPWRAANLVTFNYSYNTDNQWRADLYPLLSEYFDLIGMTIIDGGTDWAYFILRAYGYVPGGYDELQIYWVGWGPDYLNPINMIQPLISNVSTSNSAQVNDPWIEAAFVDFFSETDQDTAIERIHNISIYCVTVLFSHLFGFHALGTTIHGADIYWDVDNQEAAYGFLRYDFYAYPLARNASYDADW